MAIRRPTTIAVLKTPFEGRMGQYPGYVGMLCLWNDERRYRDARSAYTL